MEEEWSEAIAHFNDGRYEESAFILFDIVSENPTDEALRFLSRCLIYIEDPDGEFSAVDKIKDPKSMILRVT